MKVSMIGLGYIGLPTACLIADKNQDMVYGFDINENYVKSIREGAYCPEEPGLSELLGRVVRAGKLEVATSIHPADVYIIAVPTPFNVDKTCDNRFIEVAVESVCTVIKAGDLVILESTVSPGTTESVVKRIIEKRTPYAVSKDVFVAYSAERVIPGKIIEELVRNARIIGGLDPESAQRAEAVYRLFVEGEVYLTDCVTAEVTKLMENTYRDVNIALANEFALIAERFGFDVWEAIALANKHPRVNIHQPGPGVGGHCIAIDPWFFVGMDPDTTQMIQTARQINDGMPLHVVDTLKSRYPQIKRVGVMGVTYKADIDDVRTSPSTQLIKALKKQGYSVMATDPFAQDYPYDLVPWEEVVDCSEALVFMVDHGIYKTAEFLGCMRARMERGQIIYDTRNIFPPGTFPKNEVIRVGAAFSQ